MFDLVKIKFDVSRFHGHETGPSYRRDKTQQRAGVTEAPHQDDDDRMDVDEETMDESPEEYIPSHALDDLHLQIIKHFTIVIKELAERIRQEHGENGGPTTSQHAPGYRRKEFALWSLGDCLGYLGEKKKLRATQPPLEVFLLKRNEGRSWRRGQDWSRQDWLNALSALEEIGTLFVDGPVISSLSALKTHADNVFATPMRPT